MRAPRRVRQIACLLAACSALAQSAPIDASSGRPGWRQSRVRWPGEFERQEAMLLPAQQLERYPALLTTLVDRLGSRGTIALLVERRGDCARLRIKLRSQGVAPPTRCVLAPHDTVWIRDYGPMFVTGRRGYRAAVDLDYTVNGRSRDDNVPLVVGPKYGSAVLSAPLLADGGNLLGNGRGLVISTYRLLRDNQGRAGAVRSALQHLLGASQLVLLEPLDGEPTGHVDMFATFVAEDLVVVGSFDRRVDPVNAALLDRNAAKLARVVTSRGPLRVVRVPMPPPRAFLWPTYTNVVLFNGALLVPIYPQLDPVGRARALAVFHRVLPAWDVIPVDASPLVGMGGALHCATLNIPARTGAPPATIRALARARRPSWLRRIIAR